GIRDFHVTGVQPCALPICISQMAARWGMATQTVRDIPSAAQLLETHLAAGIHTDVVLVDHQLVPALSQLESVFDSEQLPVMMIRSEERRVGKGCRCGGPT